MGSVMFPKYIFHELYNMQFEHIIINNIPGVGIRKGFMFWDIYPKEIMFVVDFIT